MKKAISIVLAVLMAVIIVYVYKKISEWKNNAYSMAKLISLDRSIEGDKIATVGWLSRPPGEGMNLYFSEQDMQSSIILNSAFVKLRENSSEIYEFIKEGKLCRVKGVYEIYSGSAFLVDADYVLCGNVIFEWSLEKKVWLKRVTN